VFGIRYKTKEQIFQGLLPALKPVHLDAMLKEAPIHHSYVRIGRDLHRYDIA
jgi:hypothetical protein